MQKPIQRQNIASLHITQRLWHATLELVAGLMTVSCRSGTDSSLHWSTRRPNGSGWLLVGPLVLQAGWLKFTYFPFTSEGLFKTKSLFKTFGWASNTSVSFWNFIVKLVGVCLVKICNLLTSCAWSTCNGNLILKQNSRKVKLQR